jgi:hypothetical protein
MYQEPSGKQEESILEQMFTSTPAHSVKWTLMVEQYSQRIDDACPVGNKWIRNWKVLTYIGSDAVLRDHFSYSTR